MFYANKSLATPTASASVARSGVQGTIRPDWMVAAGLAAFAGAMA